MNQKKLAYQRGVFLGVGDIVSQITARADELVPFDTGVLSGSQTVKPTGKGTIVQVEIGYGGVRHQRSFVTGSRDQPNRPHSITTVPTPIAMKPHGR